MLHLLIYYVRSAIHISNKLTKLHFDHLIGQTHLDSISTDKSKGYKSIVKEYLKSSTLL